jgi:hypothetical protein
MGPPPSNIGSNHGQATSEYQVKLAIIEKIVMHIQWPTESKVNKESEKFYFGVYCEVHPFGSDLLKLKQERTLKWKQVEIIFFEKPEDLDNNYPDLLFVEQSFDKDLPQITEKLAGKNVLLITESERALKKGSMINFILVEGKIKFEIAEETMKGQKFKISDELRRLAYNNQVISQD